MNDLYSPVEIYDTPILGRLFVVGDLHGCYTLFMQRLTEIGFNFKDDLIISVGDLIDRGPESLQCFKLLDQPWFKAIRGNHEQFCIDSTLDPEMQSIHCKHGGGWLYGLDMTTRKSIIQRCKQLPIILEISHSGKIYGFVHADIHLNDWTKFKEAVMLNDYLLDGENSGMYTALWSQGRIKNLLPTKYQSISGVDEVYLGHTVLDSAAQIHNCFFIDTGAVFNGNLTILLLN